MSNTFQVDLRGIVDLLSHHLYASPRVYVRELLQNAVDAITATGSVESGEVRITTTDGEVVTAKADEGFLSMQNNVVTIVAGAAELL